MSKVLNDSLQQIARGTSVVFAGIIASMALNFVLRIILVRYTSQDEYGIYSLAITVVSILYTVSLLGLDEGAPRYIAYSLGKSDGQKVKKIIFSTLGLALATSVVFATALLILSDTIAVSIFHTPALSTPLQIISIAMPFMVLIQALTSVTRGFNISIIKVVFNDIMKPLSFIVLLAAVILLGLGFEAIVVAYVASMGVTLLAFAIFTMRWYSRRYDALHVIDRSVTKDLLQFSIPLLSVNMLMLLMSQATTLLLGIFKTPVEVGTFDIAITMSSMLLIVLNSLGYIYTPTASNLYGRNQVEDLKQSYIVSTKWGYIGTLPLLFVFLVFPGVVVDLLFGSRYSDVAFILQILCLGYVINPLTGPNYHTLIAMGKTRVIIESFLANAIVNLALSILLIPPLGVIGAAIAVSVSVMVANILLSVRLYQLLKIHPLTRNYVISIATSLPMIALAYFCLKYLAVIPSLTLAIVCFIVFMAIYVVSLIASKAVDKEDIMILSAIEKKLGLKVLPEAKKAL